MADDADPGDLEAQAQRAARSARARADAAMAAAREAAAAAERAEAAARFETEPEPIESDSPSDPAESAEPPEPATAGGEPVGDKADAATSEPPPPQDVSSRSARRAVITRRIRSARPTRVGALAGAALVVLLAGVVVNVLLWNSHTDHRDRADDRLAFIQAAKQGVVNMTTIDYTQADKGIQRVLDESTGQFREDFADRQKEFSDVVQQAKVSTQGKTGDAGIEKLNPDGSAVVLVSASSTVTNGAGADKEPRVWRLRVTVTPQDGALKMSKVDFVP